MARYTLIASRDAFESNEAGHWLDLAGELRAQGNDVTLFLVQNGVLAARRSGKSDALTALAGRGVRVLADTFSLKERGIAADRLAPGITAAEIDTVVDHLADGHKVIFH